MELGGYPFKLSLNGVNRRLILKDEEGGCLFDQLKTNTKALFNISSKDSKISFSYIDEDGDNITVSSADEFNLALLHSQITKFEVLVSVPSAAPATATATRSNTAVHPSITCDGCGMYPLIGDRFKCSIRRDFDLCSNCESQSIQPHPMLKIYTSEQSPATFIVTLHDNQFVGEQVDGDIPVASAFVRGRGRGWQRRMCGRGPGRGRGGPPSGPPPPPHNHPPHPHAHMPGFGPGPNSGPQQGPPFEFGPPHGGRGPMWRGPFYKQFFGFGQPKDQAQSGDDVKTAVPPNMSPEEVRANSAADAAANMVSSIITNVANIAQDAVLNPNRSTTSRSRASVPAAAPFSTVPLSKEAPQAEFVEDVTFAQGATVPANSSFVKKWAIKNTGTTPWPVNSRLEVCGHDYIFSNASKDLGDLNLDPGCSTEVSITLIAPECSGNYREYFALRDPRGNVFGPYLCVDINVSEGGEMGEWDILSSPENDEQRSATSSPFGTYKLHMQDMNGYVHFRDVNGNVAFQVAFMNNYLSMNSRMNGEWGGAESIPVDNKNIPFVAEIHVMEQGFQISFEGPKRYIIRDGKHELESGEKIVYVYNHRIPVKYFQGDVQTSGDNYQVIRVHQPQQQAPVVDENDSQETMYVLYQEELEHLAEMGFTDFSLVFPILQAMVPVPASQSDDGQVNSDQINEVVAMILARSS